MVGKTAFLHPYASPSADDFINIVAADGCEVVDDQGKRYIDAMASLWYCNIGHGRAEMVAAVNEQLGTLDAFHTFDRFTNQPAEDACAAIAATAPFPDARVFLASGGSEAVDSALKIARWAQAVRGQPQRTVIISRTPSYHGVTYGGATATGLPANQQHVGPMLPDVVHVDYDSVAQLEEQFEHHAGRVAAVIAEPVVGAGGVFAPPDGYFTALRELCDQHGALLIADEVICGFGRLGEWWGSTRYGFVPDLITFAKGVTSGYQPLGGVLVSPLVQDYLAAAGPTVFRHGHTYSGHPASCAAAVKCLEITDGEGLVDRARHVGERLAGGLGKLASHPGVNEIRGDVAMRAVGLNEGYSAPAIREHMLRDGVIIRPIGDNTLTFCPPLVISDDQIDQTVEVLAKALDASASA